MKDRGFWKKLGDFALGKGFYIVLFLCVATIGISGYYLLQTAVDNTGIAEPAGGDASVTLPEQGETEAPPAREDPPEQEAVQPEPAAEEPVIQPEDPEPVQQAAQPPEETGDERVSDVFTWPVKGAVLRDFSLEVLSRDPTMGDWRTHSGLDLAAAQGVKVLAMSAGTVEQIYELIIGSPGNYLKYYIGYAEFLELKKDWMEKKGEESTQKDFHEAVLTVGPAPFDLVEKYMWEITEQE